MNLIGGTIGAIIGGVIGAAVWAGIAYGTGYEIGWIAIGVGFVVGFGAVTGAKNEGSAALGCIAVVVSVISILGGKYFAIDLTIKSEIGDESQYIEESIQDLQDDEFVISYIADDVVQEYFDAGTVVAWPPDVDPEMASEEVDYPVDVWEEALSRWNDLSVDEQETYRTELEDYVRLSIGQMIEGAAKEGFIQSFSPIDALFFLLAIVTAFKLGMGGEAKD